MRLHTAVDARARGEEGVSVGSMRGRDTEDDCMCMEDCVVLCESMPTFAK